MTAPSSPTKVGYTFKYWSETESGSAYNFAAAITANKTLYAVFEINKYTVTFISDGKTVSTATVENGKYATAPSNPTKTGYTFSHWSTSEGGNAVNVGSYEIKRATVFYAVFTKNEVPVSVYKVTFMADGKTVSTVNVESGKYATAPTSPTKEGYSFEYWSDTKDGKKVDVSSYAIRSNTTFYAVFSEVIINYTVRFNSDGKQVSSVVVKRGETAQAPKSNPVKDGYTFLYWSLEEGGDEKDVASYKIMRDTTFYAVFELNKENPNDPELIEALRSATTELNKIALAGKQQREIRNLIVNTIKKVLQDAEDFTYIDTDYVNRVYPDEVQQVKDYINDLSEQDASEFITRIRNGMSDSTFNILTDYFLDSNTKSKYNL